jgi:hypothetical protein
MVSSPDDWKRHHAREHPHFHVFAAQVLAIAQILVGLAVVVFVPFLLRFLSVFFGSALREAAQHVRRAGGQAVGAMGSARQFLLEVHTDKAARLRVETGEGEARRRVPDRPSSNLDAEVTNSLDSEEQSSHHDASRR